MRKKLFMLLLVVLLLGMPCVATEVQAKVALNKKQVTLQVGKTITLKLKGTKRKVYWTSSNKKVATVSSTGKVKAKKIGKATITAKSGSKKYLCKLKVVKKNTNSQNEPQTPTTERPADSTTEKPTEATTEKKITEQPTEATTEKETTEQPTEATTEQGTTERPTEATTEQETTEQPTVKPEEETGSFDAGEYSIDRIHSGEATYYDRESVGAANLDYLEASYYTAAMNNEDYMNGLAGAYIEITDKDGHKINVMITDRLPEGKKGDIDLSRKAFEVIEPLVTGRMNITWKIIPLPTTEPISYVFKPTSSPYWAEVQVRNGRYPIKKLEYYDKAAGEYKELPRQEYNYFTAKSGMGEGPYTFRVTDFYGHVLEDTGIAMNNTETPVNGQANFPY